MTDRWRPIRIYQFLFYSSIAATGLQFEEFGRTPCQARRRCFRFHLEPHLRSHPELPNDFKLLRQSYLRDHPDPSSVGPLEDEELIY